MMLTTPHETRIVGDAVNSIVDNREINRHCFPYAYNICCRFSTVITAIILVVQHVTTSNKKDF